MSKIFAKNLKMYRLAAQMTQEDLAFAAGIKRSALSNYELNRSEPDFQTLITFSNVLGIDPTDLVVDHATIPDYWRKLQVTQDEEFLLELYRHADPVYRQVAEDILKQHQTSGRFANANKES